MHQNLTIATWVQKPSYFGSINKYKIPCRFSHLFISNIDTIIWLCLCYTTLSVQFIQDVHVNISYKNKQCAVHHYFFVFNSDVYMNILCSGSVTPDVTQTKPHNSAYNVSHYHQLPNTALFWKDPSKSIIKQKYQYQVINSTKNGFVYATPECYSRCSFIQDVRMNIPHKTNNVEFISTFLFSFQVFI